VEYVLFSLVKNVTLIVAIMTMNFHFIALDLWLVIKNVVNLYVILLKLKRKLEVFYFLD